MILIHPRSVYELPGRPRKNPGRCPEDEQQEQQPLQKKEKPLQEQEQEPLQEQEQQPLQEQEQERISLPYAPGRLRKVYGRIPRKDFRHNTLVTGFLQTIMSLFLFILLISVTCGPYFRIHGDFLVSIPPMFTPKDALGVIWGAKRKCWNQV